MQSYKNKSFCLVTLGCPKNQVDSEVLAGQFEMQGIQLTENADEADVILINTCGFIEDAKQESIDTILEAVQLKQEGRGREVYVWGCLSQRYAGEMNREIPEVDGFFGIEPFEQMGQYFFGNTYRIGQNFHAGRILTTPSHTAYLKIAEGCDHGCTFCAIPQFKGSYRSRSSEDILREAEALSERGVRELILIAQDTTRYGADLPDKTALPRLLEQLAKIESIQWLRIMYAHPNHVTDALIEVMAGEDKVCSYLDMPLQHISDPVLNAMGRGGSRKSIEELIDRMRGRIPGLILRSAFIVGFPNESEACFEELISFVKSAAFERLGVFIYSPEEGTAAYPLGNPVTRDEAEFRYARLMEVQQELSEAANLRLEGTLQSVLIDEFDRDQKLFIGRTYGDCLEVDQTVWVSGIAETGRIIPVHIDDSGPYDLFGTAV